MSESSTSLNPLAASFIPTLEASIAPLLAGSDSDDDAARPDDAVKDESKAVDKSDLPSSLDVPVQNDKGEEEVLDSDNAEVAAASVPPKIEDPGMFV